MARERPNVSDLALGHLSPEESLRLLDRIESDGEASAELELHIGLVNLAQSRGEEIFRIRPNRAGAEGFSPGVRESTPVWVPSIRPAILLRAAALLLVPVLLLVGADRLITDPYAHLARVEKPEFSVLVRAGEREDVNLAYRLLDAGQYDEALRLFERFARAFPGSDIVDYVHYSAGSVYLMTAQNSNMTPTPAISPPRVLSSKFCANPIISFSTSSCP